MDSKFQQEMGPYDLMSELPEACIESLGGRPAFRQRTGSSILYWIESNWVVGTEVGSFDGVSFFAQDDALSPCDISVEWYELAGAEGAASNPSVFVEPLSSGVTAQLLQLAAEQSTSITAVRQVHT
jgi:hypothetical protein